jgi:cytochrome c
MNAKVNNKARSTSQGFHITAKEDPVSPRSKNQAKKWVEQAIAFYKVSGKRIALAAFTDLSGMFVKDEIYIFVLNPKGTMLAHGVNEKFVGEEFIDLMDSDGKRFIKEIVDTANANGSGWVEYKWYNPVTREWRPKIVYFEKIDNLIICTGVYE